MSEKTQILIVDDDPFSLILLKEYLKTLNADIFCVSNGKEAVEFCRKYSVNLLLIDIFMPVMNGFDAPKSIRKDHKQIKVIVQTASASQEKNAAFISSGIDALIIKPYKKNELLTIIENVLLSSNKIKDEPLYC